MHVHLENPELSKVLVEAVPKELFLPPRWNVLENNKVNADHKLINK